MYKRSLFVLLAAVALLSLGAQNSQAQSFLMNLPRPSQRAELVQRIGITDITISYHRPLVNGRKIWGGLVPYGQVWRAGANENTTIEFTSPVSIEGKPLAQGIYGVHMIPGENEWTVIFSKMAVAWGSFSYDQAEDALRVTVKPQPTDMHEALTYDFDDLRADSSVVTLRWEKTAVPFKVAVNLNETVEASLRNQFRGLLQYTWMGWDDAATYLVDKKGNLQDALKYVDRSIQSEDRFDNQMTKARVLEALGQKDEATAVRNKALDTGTVIQVHSYGRQMMIAGHQQQGLEAFQVNIKKDPNNWIVHSEIARTAVSKGDYDTAVKEMKLCLAGAPDPQKPQIQGLLKRVEAKEDINK
jgi:tetratricopeptide (TPR) repeat protein